MRGVYQHCSEKHLHRYLAEFDSRYSNRVKLGVDDSLRAGIALKRPADHSVVIDAATAFYEFTVATNEVVARHDAANVHKAHRTLQ